VVDTNILFSFFWKESFTRKLLLSKKFELIAPKIALLELERYYNEICKKVKINKKEFDKLLDELKKFVKFVEGKEYSSFTNEAIKISPDETDVDFFALCMLNSCFLWSNDALLKDQNRIDVFSTEEILDLLF
jgi:predicted nucleic acid-binding protein